MKIKIIFHQSLTNWGRDELTTDLTADEDSVQVVVFYQYEEKVDPLPNPPVYAIEWKVDYGDANVAGQTDIVVSGDEYGEVFCFIIRNSWKMYPIHYFFYYRLRAQIT